MTTNFSKAIAANGAILASTLREHGFASLTFTYLGGGDSGELNNIALDHADPDNNWPADINAQITYHAVEFKPDDNGHYRHVLVERTADFDTATSDFWELVERTQIGNGWETNLGGGGTIKIESTGAVTVDHYDYILSKTNENKTDLTGSYDVLASLGNKLKEIGATSVTMEYSGAEGDINHEYYKFTWVDGNESKSAPDGLLEELHDEFFTIINEKNGQEWSRGDGSEGLFTLNSDGTADIASADIFEDKEYAGEVVFRETDYAPETDSPAP